jgi:hypothetical protein
MVSAQGIYLVSISVSILQLAQATYSSSQAAQNNSTPTYACLYVALALGIFATSTCCLDAARMASKIDEDAFRRGIYAQADTIFRINPIVLFVAQFALALGIGFLVGSTQRRAVANAFSITSMAGFVIWVISFAALFRKKPLAS